MQAYHFSFLGKLHILFIARIVQSKLDNVNDHVMHKMIS